MLNKLTTVCLLAYIALCATSCVSAEGSDTEERSMFDADTANYADDECRSCQECPAEQVDQRVWYDYGTNLTWQVASPKEAFSYYLSESYCENLVLNGYDNWRMPTFGEMKSIVTGCLIGCSMGDDCLGAECSGNACKACQPGEGPGLNGNYWPLGFEGKNGVYWTTTDLAGRDRIKYGFHSYTGGIFTYHMGMDAYVRCVRN